MRLKDARNITRKFIRDNYEYSPTLANDWQIYKATYNDRVYFTSESEDIFILLGSPSTFLNNYLLNDKFTIINTSIKGSYYLTSIGLVSEDDFYLAETVIEQHSLKFKKDELTEGNSYVSDKGLSYLYLGTLKINTVRIINKTLKKEVFETPELLWDVINKKYIKLSSVKLVKEEEKIFVFNLDVKVDYIDNLVDSDLELCSYIEIETSINNIEINNLDCNELFFDLADDFNIDFEEIDKFIISEDERLELSEKEKIEITKEDNYFRRDNDISNYIISRYYTS